MPNNTHLPAVAPTIGGELTISGPQRIATRMAENLLTNARNQERALAGQQRYWIGGYEFREADNEQIQRWALMLGMQPEAVVEVLSNCQKKPFVASRRVNADFRVQDGSIVSLVWDFALFPVTDWAWVEDLRVERLGILNPLNGHLPTLPRSLRELFCYDGGLTSLDLTSVPDLTKLNCGSNLLTFLDLTPVPDLIELDCGWNPVNHLDLTAVQCLENLYCIDNQLSQLDLAPVPKLTVLDCGHNQLTHLDLASVPRLKKLGCWSNEISHLNLRPVQGLTELSCDSNQMTQLDLAPVPELTVLLCASNQLTYLDLTPVSRLTCLICADNQLSHLDLTPVPELVELTCDSSVQFAGASEYLEVSRL